MLSKNNEWRLIRDDYPRTACSGRPFGQTIPNNIKSKGHWCPECSLIN